MFWASDPESPPCRLVPGFRFRCATCGGQGMVDEMQTFSIQNESSRANEEASAPTPPQPMTNGHQVELRLLK